MAIKASVTLSPRLPAVRLFKFMASAHIGVGRELFKGDVMYCLYSFQVSINSITVIVVHDSLQLPYATRGGELIHG